MVVRFRINATGETVTKFFTSPYLAEKFIRKLQFSKEVTLISYGKPYLFPQKGEPMDKETLILTLAARTNQSREAAERALNAVLDIVTETLASGESVKIVGFGSFNMKKKAKIVSNSPFADVPFHIPTAFVPNFTPGKRLRDLITPIEEGDDSPC